MSSPAASPTTLPQPSPSDGPPPPPPPPSSSAPNITSANYFFGFVITFVVLLLLFIGCGLGSWRRLRLIGTAWDAQLQDMEGNPFGARKRARRRLVRPTFQDVWTAPVTSSFSAAAAHLAPYKWEDVQPVSAALIWSRSTLIDAVGRWKSDADATPMQQPLSPNQQNERDGGGGGSSSSRIALHDLGMTLRSYVSPRRPHGERPSSRPPPVQRRPLPEALQVAVVIAMPSQLLPPPSSSGRTTDDSGPKYVGQPGVGEYQIGAMRIPWPSSEGP